MVKRAAPSRLVDIRATDGGVGGGVRGGESAAGSGALPELVGSNDRPASADGYRVHPADCKRIARTRAFFDALDERDDDTGYALARAAADALPDCDCFPDV